MVEEDISTVIMINIARIVFLIGFKIGMPAQATQIFKVSNVNHLSVRYIIFGFLEDVLKKEKEDM